MRDKKIYLDDVDGAEFIEDYTKKVDEGICPMCGKPMFHDKFKLAVQVPFDPPPEGHCDSCGMYFFPFMPGDDGSMVISPRKIIKN
jgi:hypothetical protein